jgi:hypothetical protein
MEYLPDVYQHFERAFPHVHSAHQDLAKACYEGGPLDERAARLVKLGIALGAQAEGAVRSQRRVTRCDARCSHIDHTQLASTSALAVKCPYDLRCDRPVLVSPRSPAVCGDYPRQQAFPLSPTGDHRQPAEVSGDLLRDVCGMRSLP